MFVTFDRVTTTALIALLVFAGFGCVGEMPQTETNDEGIAPIDTNSNGASAELCVSHADCGAGHICQAGNCAPNWSGGPCEFDLNCIDGEMCGAGDCIPSGPSGTDMACGGEVFQATPIPPNVLIVLDRSGSMDEAIGDQGTKWEIAQDAIGQVVTNYGEEVRFGLALYPGLDPACAQGVGCSHGAVFVEIGPDTAPPITDVLASAQTCSLGTPTAEALEALTDYPALEDSERPNFILLVTDGKSTCANPVPVVAALHGQSPTIETFVVGFGTDVDPLELNQMADAGGTALMGNPMYYQADDAQALVDAFGDIAGSVLSCSYVLDMVPPDPNELYVYINGMKITRDVGHVNGWDYDPASNQVTFYGQACELLQSGEASDLEFIFGCPEAG